MTGLTLKADLLPGPLLIKSGKFALTPRLISVADVEAESLDAALTLTGRLDDYLEGVNGLDINFKGSSGENAIRWLLKQAQMPPHLLIRPPLKVSKGHFTWRRAGRTTVSGEVNIHRDLNVSATASVVSSIVPRTMIRPTLPKGG